MVMSTAHDRHLRFIVAIAVTVAWVVSFVADLVIPDYDPPGSVGALMLLVAGALFGEGVVRGARRRNSNENG